MSDKLADVVARLSPVGLLHDSHRCDGSSAVFDTTAGELRLDCWDRDILRLRLGSDDGPDYGLIGKPTSSQSVVVESGTDVVVSAGDFTVTMGREPLSIEVAHQGRPLLAPPTDAHFTRRFRIPPLAAADGIHAVAFDLKDLDRLHGTGERWASLDLRGSEVENYNEDSLGGNASMSYKNVPLVWSDAGWGLFFNTPAPVRHSMGCPNVAHRSYVGLVEGALDLFLFRGDHPREIIKSYHRLTGMPASLPKWGFGAWLSKAYYKTQQELLDSAKQMKDKGLDCKVIVLDGRTWLDTATRFAFEWDGKRYPDPRLTVDKLRSLGYRVCVWVYPFCSVTNPMYASLAERGLFLKDRTGKPYVYRFSAEPFGKDLSQLPDSGMVDFTNPEACRWWREGCVRLLDLGVDAIKTDFGEQVPDDAVAHNGDSGIRLHNVYSLLYNRTTSEAFKDAGKPPVLWARSAWSGSQAYPGHWCGDSQSDWGGLRTAIRGCLQWMMSGGSITGSDIGGFYGGPPSPELYVRWLQFGALSGLMRMHGIGNREPYAYGKRVENIARKWLAMRNALVPYLSAAAAQAENDSMPVMRPLVLAYPGVAPSSRENDLQFMFGDDLFCAPVTEAGGAVRFWIPPGVWNDHFRGRRLKGGRWSSRKCTLGEIPLLVREGSSVDLG